MATLTVQNVDYDGLNPSLAAADAGGDEFANPDEKTFLEVENGDASSHDVTVAAQETCNQGTSHDVVVTVPAGERRFIGPFKKTRYNDGSGNVQVTYDGVTSVTVGAFKLNDNG